MRYIILLIALCQVAEAQSIVISGDRRSMVVSGRSDIQIGPVVTTPIVAEPVKPAITEPVRQKPVKVIHRVKHRTRYLVSESWCANCPAAKARFVRNGWPAQNIITIAQCRQKFGFSVPHVPYEFIEPESVQAAKSVEKLQDSPLTIRNSVWGQQPDRISPQSRYINYPGWGLIDILTFDCGRTNCPMCRDIRAMRKVYLEQQSQASLPSSQQPCPMETVNAMLDAMRLTSDDVLADLGCGDGRILIAAAKRGVRGIGVELDHARAEAAIQNVKDAGVSHLVSIEAGVDARNFDTSKATAITAYLYPTLLAELAPKMKAARVAASPFHEVPGLAMIQHGDVWIYHRASTKSGFFGHVGTSHESRETLISHLLNDGIHRGRWNANQLQRMTDEQLDAAHNRDHSG